MLLIPLLNFRLKTGYSRNIPGSLCEKCMRQLKCIQDFVLATNFGAIKGVIDFSSLSFHLNYDSNATLSSGLQGAFIMLIVIAMNHNKLALQRDNPIPAKRTGSSSGDTLTAFENGQVVTDDAAQSSGKICDNSGDKNALNPLFNQYLWKAVFSPRQLLPQNTPVKSQKHLSHFMAYVDKIVYCAIWYIHFVSLIAMKEIGCSKKSHKSEPLSSLFTHKSNYTDADLSWNFLKELLEDGAMTTVFPSVSVKPHTSCAERACSFVYLFLFSLLLEIIQMLKPENVALKLHSRPFFEKFLGNSDLDVGRTTVSKKKERKKIGVITCMKLEDIEGYFKYVNLFSYTALIADLSHPIGAKIKALNNDGRMDSLENLNGSERLTNK
ncbi:hypothetical protein EGR_04282 [Echinococcus granulosus]|uniref:Uncharacterized protein n=1 Tax=Echinococcus granulosus TaxID=6210 RepID=W6UIF1_ECHGR|nr:hypothetical protein EGR_04282 [Echinococcus granulosus]EUB60843.1 hypothetical protein EGR_04282 [Echinococcus granulosus]